VVAEEDLIDPSGHHHPSARLHRRVTTIAAPAMPVSPVISVSPRRREGATVAVQLVAAIGINLNGAPASMRRIEKTC